MERAGITDPADVHYVQTKTPLLTIDTITRRQARAARRSWTEDTLKSMDVSNGTTALGIAVALGEIEMPTAEQITRTCRCSPRSPRARRASSSTRRRSSCSATPAGSAAATASATA